MLTAEQDRNVVLVNLLFLAHKKEKKKKNNINIEARKKKRSD